jgi:hypothetical protein
MEVTMKKVLIITVLFSIAMNVWGQSAWIYDQQWSGTTNYLGSGKAEFDYNKNLHDNWVSGKLQIIERPSNEQENIIKYGLGKYTVRNNDVYVVLFNNSISKRVYYALVIITGFTGGGYNFSYYLWEDLSYRRN